MRDSLKTREMGYLTDIDYEIGLSGETCGAGELEGAKCRALKSVKFTVRRSAIATISRNSFRVIVFSQHRTQALALSLHFQDNRGNSGTYESPGTIWGFFIAPKSQIDITDTRTQIGVNED
jgi:hypothetical protein